MGAAIRMISIAVAPPCELVRWVLDHRRLVYTEECHIPIFHAIATQRAAKTNEVPATIVAEEALPGAQKAVDYLEARAPEEQKLVPRKEAAEVLALYELFWQLGLATRAWAYACMLPQNG